MRERTKLLSETIIKKYVDEHGDKNTEVIREEISFDEGSNNWLRGTTNRRGYYLHVSPRTLKETPEGYKSTLTALGGDARRSGIKAFLEPAARFSKKRLAEIVAPEETLAALRARVYPEPAPIEQGGL